MDGVGSAKDDRLYNTAISVSSEPPQEITSLSPLAPTHFRVFNIVQFQFRTNGALPKTVFIKSAASAFFLDETSVKSNSSMANPLMITAVPTYATDPVLVMLIIYGDIRGIATCVNPAMIMFRVT